MLRHAARRASLVLDAAVSSRAAAPTWNTVSGCCAQNMLGTAPYCKSIQVLRRIHNAAHVQGQTAAANELVTGSAHAGLQALRERFHSSVAPLVDQADRGAASARQAVDQAAEQDQQPNQGDDVGVGPEDGASEQSATTEFLQAVNEQHRSVTEELKAQVSLDGAVPCLCCRQPIPC